MGTHTYKMGVIKVKPGKENRIIFVSWYCNPFLKRYSWRWSPAASVVAIQGMTNTHAASSHETAIIISSFSKWLLWVIVFRNTAIDIVTDITTGICVIMAIIGTFIKILVDKVNCDMVNKVCGNYQSTRSQKPATIPKLPPIPEAVITINRAAAGDHVWYITIETNINNMPFSLTLCHFRWHWGVQNTNYDIKINAICSVSVRF